MNSGLLRTSYLQIPIIIILGLLVYSNTLNAEFTFDDEYYIVLNPAIKDFSYFAEPSKTFELNSIPGSHRLAFINIPINFRLAFITRIGTHFTFALNYHLHKLDVIGYHFVNILVHVINGLLVYSLIRLIFQTPFFSSSGSAQKNNTTLSSNLFAFFAALIFISHPIQTQAVTYISQRFASLAALFFLLSLVAYIKSRLSEVKFEKYTLYGFAFISSTISMLVKENSITLPVIIALSELMFFQESMKKRVIYLFPFTLIILVIPLTLLIAADASFSIGNIVHSMQSLTATSEEALSKWDYLFTQFRVIMTYLRLLFLPVNQNLDYDYPVYHSFYAPPVLFSFVFLLLFFFLGIYLYFRSESSKSANRYDLKLISFGIFWFFITLSVESSIVVLRNVIFEHRLYLPAVGVIICVMAVISMAANEIKSKTAFRLLITSIAIAVFVLAGAAYARNSVWRDNILLWGDVVSKSPQKARPHINLGVALDNDGRKDEAIKEYMIAIEIDPEHFTPHYRLGYIYMRQGRTEDAIREYVLATRINKYSFDAHINLGILYAQKGLLGEALKEFQEAAAIAPDNVSARKNIEIITSIINDLKKE